MTGEAQNSIFDSPSIPQRGSSQTVLRWIFALFGAALLGEQVVVGLTLIYPALGRIAETYHTTDVIVVATIFTLVGGIMTPLAGKLADRYGKRRVLLIMTGVASGGLLLSAVTPSFGLLLVGRAMSGASITYVPLLYSLIAEVFPARRRAISIAILTNGLGVGAVLGPFLAGALIDRYGFRSVFWFLLAATVIGALLVRAAFRETDVRLNGRMDWRGAVLVSASFLCILLGLSEGQKWGWTAPLTIGCFALGLFLLLIFAWIGLHSEDPFVDLRVLASRPVFATVAAATLFAGATTIAASYAPVVAQTPPGSGLGYGFGISATQWGLWAILGGVLMVASGLCVGTFGTRTGFRFWMIVSGIALVVASVTLPFTFKSAPAFVIAFGLTGVGAAFYAATPSIILLTVPEKFRTVSAGTAVSIQSVGSSLCALVAGAVIAGHVGVVIAGTPYESLGGMQLAFFLAAGIALLGLVSALIIPRTLRRRAAAAAEVTEAQASLSPAAEL